MIDQFPTPATDRLNQALQIAADLDSRLRRAERERDLWKRRYDSLSTSSLLLAGALLTVTATLIILVLKTH